MKHPLTVSPTAQKVVFELFNCIRGEVATDAYTVVPALLILARTGSFQEVVNKWADKDLYTIFAAALRLEAGKMDTEGMQESVRTISAFSPATHKYLLQCLRILDLPMLSQAAFESIFDYALDSSLQFAGRDSGQWQMPVEVVELAASIYEIGANERVFNPCAGTAQLISYLEQSVEYVGMEENHRILNLAALRHIAHRRPATSLVYGAPDGIWPEMASWDFICSPTPITPRRIANTPSIRPNAARATVPTDVAVIQAALHHLAEGGRAVLAVSQSFLARNDTNRFRQLILAQDWLESVIELPAGVLLPYASFAFAFLTFNVNKARQGEVLFVDAEPFTEAGRDRRRVLNVAELLHAIRHPQSSAHTRYVNHEQVAADEFNMIPRRYTRALEESPNDVKLSRLVEQINLVRRNMPEEGPLLTIRGLQTDSLNFQLPSVTLHSNVMPLRNAYRLSESALLLAVDGTQLKPTWFTASVDTEIFVQRSIIALRIDAKQVDLAYLVSELNSDYVLNQVNAMQVGNVTSHLTTRDLMRLRIRLPEMAEQKAAVSGARSALIKLKEQELTQLRALDEQKTDAFEQFALFKHSLGRPLANINSGLRRLQNMVKNHGEAGGTISLTSLLSTRPDDTVGKTFASLKKELEFIHQRLVRSEEQLLLDKSKLKSIALLDYLDGLQKRVSSNTVYELTVEPTFEISISRDLGMPVSEWLQVLGEEHLLDLMFNHILDNAERHGFQSRPGLANQPTNKVVIRVAYSYMDDTTTTDLCILIWVENNGLPFPEGFELSSLTQKDATAGPTGNSGLGGYQARDIARFLGGDLEAFSKPKHEFPVSYLITLPIFANDNSADTNDNNDDDTDLALPSTLD